MIAAVEFSFVIRDRFVVPSLLPMQGVIKDMKIVKSIRDKVAFSKEEREEFEITEVTDPQGQVALHWNDQKDRPVSVTLSLDEAIFLKVRAMEVNAAKRVTLDTLDAIEKVIETVTAAQKPRD